MGSHILLNFFVIAALVYMASGEDVATYKMLAYGESFSAYPWQRVVYRTKPQRIQRREDDLNPYEANYTRPTWPTTTTTEGEIIYKKKDSGVPAYSMPVPVVFISSYPKSKY